MLDFTRSLAQRKLGLVAMVVLLAALAGGVTAGAVLGSGSGSPAAKPEAAIIGDTPSVTFLATPPASVLSGDLVDIAQIFAFNERHGVVLAAPLHVDQIGVPVNSVPPATTVGPSDSSPPFVTFVSGDIPTGTVVNSHFIHFRPAADNRSTGKVTFDGDILGVIFTPAGLDATDATLGLAATAYPSGKAGRAIEVGFFDNVVISGDKRTLDVHLGFELLGGDFFDQVRVITQAPPPGPGPLPRMPSLQQQLDILNIRGPGGTGGAPSELAHSAIEQLPGMLLGPPIVLPTSGGTVTMETWTETQRFAKRTALDLEEAIKALTGVKMGDATHAPHPNPGVRAHANQVSVLLEATLSVVRGLKGQVKGIDPAGTIPPHLRAERSKIEGPFLPLAPMRFAQFPIERTEVCNIDSAESSGSGTTSGGSFSEFSKHSSACIITKESFGVKAVLFHRIIPIYPEPWDVRESPIIGHEVVWYIRWIPAEHIKTIIYEKDTSGRIRTRIRQHDVLMPGLSKFWSFYPPGIPHKSQAPPAP